LVGRRIMSALPRIYCCGFQLRPDPYLATSHDRYILSFVIFGDSIGSLKFLPLPSPLWVTHHPDMKRLPVGTQVSQRQSNHSWFLFFLTGEDRRICLLIEGLQHGTEASTLAEQEPEPTRAGALDDLI